MLTAGFVSFCWFGVDVNSGVVSSAGFGVDVNSGVLSLSAVLC